MRRCYSVWHTPVELLRRRKFTKDSRLSRSAFTTLHHYCYSEFLSFHSHYLHILSTVAKGKVNGIAHKHKVNGPIRAYTSIRQMEHSFSLIFCKNGCKFAAGCHITSIPHISCKWSIQLICTWGAIHTVTAAAECRCRVLEHLCCHPSSVKHDFV